MFPNQVHDSANDRALVRRGRRCGPVPPRLEVCGVDAPAMLPVARRPRESRNPSRLILPGTCGVTSGPPQAAHVSHVPIGSQASQSEPNLAYSWSHQACSWR